MKASTGTITVDAVVFDEYGSTATYSLDIAIEPNNFVCSELSATREAVSNDLRLAQLGNFYQIATAEWTKANCNRAGADEVQRQVRSFSSLQLASILLSKPRERFSKLKLA